MATRRPALPAFTVRVRAELRRAAAASPRLLRRPTSVVAFVRAVVLFAAAEVAVRTTRLPSAARWFGAELEFSDAAPGRAGSTLSLSAAERRRLAVLTRVARHWPLGPRGACLRLSLAAARELRAHEPRLRLAVGHDHSQELAAHAWLEVDGIAVTDPGNYVPLLAPRPPEERATSS